MSTSRTWTTISLPRKTSTSYECFFVLCGRRESLCCFLFSGLVVYHCVTLLSLPAVRCTVLYRVSTLEDYPPSQPQRPGRGTIKADRDRAITATFFSDHEMDNHRLKTWLQLHLATDASTVTNLPFVLNSLTEDDFLSPGHVQKWTIRINSLIHSKEPGARWAGLSIALRTATLSRNVMNECAHGWITIALPMLTVRSLILLVFPPTLMDLLIEERDFAMHQSLHPFDTVHLLEQRWTHRVPTTGRSSQRRQVFPSVDRDRWEV